MCTFRKSEYMRAIVARACIWQCANVACAVLAKRLGVSETFVRRMLDPKHDTKPDRFQVALVALGKRIVVTFDDAT